MQVQSRPIAEQSTEARARSVRGLTLDHLWVASLLALVWMFISILPLPPNDLWWHMAAGRTTLAEGALIQANRWSYTLPTDAPYFYQSWLSELALYWLWRLGDVPLLTLARTLVIVLSYGLVCWHALRRTGNGRAVTLALLLVVLASWDNWTLRPQTLALLPAAAFAVTLGEYLAGRVRARWLLALPALMIVWVNAHGSFVLGPGLLGLAWLGAALDALRRGTPEAATARGRLLPLAGALAATGLALLVNPKGPGIISYVSGLTSNPSVLNHILEWQPPRNAFNPLDPGFWFFVLLLLLAALMARGQRRPSVTDVLWYCGTAWLAIGAVRNVMWFALFMLPLLADQFAQRLGTRPALRLHAGAGALFGLVLGGVMLATLPWFTPARYLGPGGEKLYADSGAYRLLLSSTTPVGASEWLAQHPMPGRFWTDMTYASYTTWRLPERQIFTDMRIELFPETIWRDYYDIATADPRTLALLDKWQITHMLLRLDSQPELDALLKRTPGWCERYRDARAAVFQRCN